MKSIPLLVCDGQCHRDGTCFGDIRRVEILDQRGSWGRYNYCQTAIKCDERNGYLIKDADSIDYNICQTQNFIKSIVI